MQNNKVQVIAPKRGHSVREAAQYCGVSIEMLNQLRSQGAVNGLTGPRFLKLGKKVIYQREALDEWLDSFPQAHSLAELSVIKKLG